MDEITILKKINDFFVKPEGKYLLNVLILKKYELLDELSEVKVDDFYQLQGQIKGIHELISFINNIDVEISNKNINDIDNF